MRAKGPGLGALLAAALVAAPAGAATVYVGQQGTDGPSCGAKATPCRSISQGIEVAGAGDTLRVGPGRYGDLNGDGAFDDPGDELGELGNGCDCMIRVAKRLTLRSEAGAGATVIDGAGIAPTLVEVDYGLQLEGQGGELRDDVLVGNRVNGLLVVDGTANALLTRVQVLGNGGSGIVAAAPLVLRGGRIVGNDAGETNCGVEVVTGSALDAEGVFWGSAAGPGDDFADAVCFDLGTTVDTDPPATKPAKLKLKPLR